MTQKFGVPTDEQLTKINKLSKRTLSAEEVFVFPSKLAGDMIIPDRYVQLTKELLDVFATDANKGVSFLLDHSWHADGFWGMGGRPRAAIPYGRTFNSSYGPATEEGETISLNSDTYMPRGVEIDGIKTNDLIQSIEAGTLFDTSIGFSYNKGICSICGNNYNDYDKCEHYAGKTYEIEENGVVKNKLCFIMAYPPGGLWENSGVFDGAYPGAGMLSKDGDILENETGIYQVITELKEIDLTRPIIATYSGRSGLLTMVKKSEHKKPFSLGGLAQKAQGMITDQESIFALGQRLGMSNDQVINIANIVLKGGEKPMNEKLTKMFEAFGIAFKEGEIKLEEALNQLAEKWDANAKIIQDSASELLPPPEVYMTQDQAKEKLGKELSADEVLKLAKEGQDYHKQVIDDAIAMGVRAQGNDFPAETWKNTFIGMGTAQIKDIMKTFESQAISEIPANRHTNLGAGQHAQSQSVPEEMYRVGR